MKSFVSGSFVTITTSANICSSGSIKLYAHDPINYYAHEMIAGKPVSIQQQHGSSSSSHHNISSIGGYMDWWNSPDVWKGWR